MELRVPGGEHFLRIGQAYGDVDALAVQREMIRRTIKEHLDKEKTAAAPGDQGSEPVLHRCSRKIPQVR